MFKNISKFKKIKFLFLTVCCLMILGTVSFKTYAWFSSKTQTINSLFTYGDIKISIIDDDIKENEPKINYNIMPGSKIEKSTRVKVSKGSEDCWLFVEINKSDNFDIFMTYEIDEEWKLLDDTSNIYYKEVSKQNNDQEFSIIKDNVVSVRTEIDNKTLSLLSDEEEYPSLTVSAYAVQRDKKIDAIDTASKAWLLINNQSN